MNDYSKGRKSAASRGSYNTNSAISGDLAPVPVDPRVKKYKRGFFWCLCLGILLSPNSPFIGVPLLCGAVYFYVKKKKTIKEIAKSEEIAAAEAAARQQAEIERQRANAAAAEAEWQQFLDENELVRTIHTKVVGVTYRNSDGSSRQENLSYCITGGNIELEHFTYRGAPAYSVSCGGLQIGNLPADLARDLYELDDSYTIVGEFDEVTGGENGLKYGCNILVHLYRRK